jgi:hypothetical protein
MEGVELRPICVLPHSCRRDLKEALARLEAVQDLVSGISSAAGEAVAAAAARIREVLAEAGAQKECCPECGGTEFYAPSWGCKLTHCVNCGAALDHGEDCWIPPEVLRAEKRGNIELAARIAWEWWDPCRG